MKILAVQGQPLCLAPPDRWTETAPSAWARQLSWNPGRTKTDLWDQSLLFLAQKLNPGVPTTGFNYICPQLLTYTWLNWISWTIESNLVKHVNPSKSSTKIPPQNPFNKSIQQNPSVNPSNKVCRIVVVVFLPRVLDVFLAFLPGTICLVFATVGN